LAVLYGCLAVSSVREKSTTFDELAHLTAGYTYWKFGDFRLQPENGNFPQRWAALPLLLSKPRFPALDQPGWRQSNVWAMGHQFFFETGNDADRMLWQGRAMIAALGAILALIVYTWSRHLFGAAGGYLSLVLYVFSPTMLAHGALATSDMAAALFFTASLGTLWYLYHRISWIPFIASSLALAGLFLSKMSAVLILPMALVIALVRLAGGRPWLVAFKEKVLIVKRGQMVSVIAGLAIVQVLAVWVAIWLSSDMRYSAFQEEDSKEHQLYPGGWSYVLEKPGWATTGIDYLRRCQVLPEEYLYGFSMVRHYAGERRGFLNGEVRTTGWPWFFPYCFLVKTPLPLLLILVFAAAAAWLGGNSYLPEKRFFLRAYRYTPLFALLGVYWIAAVLSHLNIGHRHLLPIYPVTFILAGAAAYWLRKRPNRLPRVAVLSLVLWFAAESLYTWPNYLSYFNQIVGGPWYGYRHLVDSSLDWGQDLPGLKKWLDARGLSGGSDGRDVYLSYFGTGSPEYYGIHARYLPGFGIPEPPTREPEALQPGTYCISATMLQGVYSVIPGAWSLENESDYQQLLSFVSQYENSRSDTRARESLLKSAGNPDAAQIGHLFHLFEQFRLARLCAYLRLGQPADEIGHSILIYHLNDKDLNQAIYQPPETWVQRADAAGRR
jgi:hypothetical protein